MEVEEMNTDSKLCIFFLIVAILFGIMNFTIDQPTGEDLSMSGFMTLGTLILSSLFFITSGEGESMK